MSTITTRAGKGTALSYAEMDANFTNLNNDKLEASALSPYETSAHAAATYATQTALAATNTTVAGKQDALPSQTGNNGKYLGTNGTTLSWNTISEVPSQTGNSGKYLTTNGTTASWVTFSGVSLNGVETLTNKTLTTPVINTNINYSGTGGAIQVGGVDKVIIGAGGISSGIAQSAIPQPLTLGTAQNTTSGTAIDFTGIPSWVKRITLSFRGLSTNGTSIPTVRLGSGSVQTTGYSSVTIGIAGAQNPTGTTWTDGFGLVSINHAASYAYHGLIIFTLLGNNTWCACGNLSIPGVANTQIAGSVSLSGVLDRLRITMQNGTDTFDAGSVNILYE